MKSLVWTADARGQQSNSWGTDVSEDRIAKTMDGGRFENHFGTSSNVKTKEKKSESA